MALSLPQAFDTTDYDSPTLGDPLQVNPGLFDYSNISITPVSLSNAVVGVAYTQQITIAGGLAPYDNLYVSSGNLPANLTLSSTTNDLINDSANANITGIPTTYGNITFTIQGNDNIANAIFTTTQTYTMFVDYPTITITPTTLANGVVGEPYSETFIANGGTGPYTYSNVGNLPQSLTLSNSGVLTGNITTATTPQSLTIRATDSYNSTGNSTYSLNISRPTITVAPSSLPNAVTGTSYSQTITANGGTAPYSYAVTGNTLPNNLTLNPTTGLISGVVTADGTSNFKITATDVYSTQGNINYSIVTTDPTILISPSSVPNGVVGEIYLQTFTSSGGTSPYTYTVTGGNLPANVTLNSSGTLTGLANTAQTTSFTITSTDAFSSQGSFTYANVVIAQPTITVVPAELGNAIVDSPYNAHISAYGGIDPYTFAVTDGALPPGLTLSNIGYITGTPTSVNTFNFTVTAYDYYSSSGNIVYDLRVNPPPIEVSPLTVPQGVVGVFYTETFTASGGTAPYTYNSPRLPPGLSIAVDTGVMSGSPQVEGYEQFTIVATDDHGYTGERIYDFVVAPNVPTSAIEVFVGGTLQNSGYEITSKAPATADFTTAPDAGVDVTLAVRQGADWYQPGPFTPSNGVPLQETNTQAARFLRGF